MSVRRFLLGALLAILLFSYFVIARFPAAQGLALASRFSQGMVMYSQASGTIWQGQADHIYISVQQQVIDLGKTTWQLKALPLLFGQLQMALEAKQGRQLVKAKIKASASAANLQDVEVRLPLATLLSFAPMPLPIQIEGQLQLDLQQLELNQTQGIAAVSGNAVVQDVVVEMHEKIELGSYGARLSKEGDELMAKVSDVDATVELSGTMQANLQASSYASDVLLKPKAEANPLIAQTLAMVARKQNDGRYHFKQNGHF